MNREQSTTANHKDCGNTPSACEFYVQGNEFRRKGDFAEAIRCYNEAISIDPESPAVQAKEMLNDILNFYCKDFYNP